jgi:hypothetical protein
VDINLLYSVAGVLVGLIVGLTGVGGGSLMTPLLVLVFGFHPATAVGTDLLYARVDLIGRATAPDVRGLDLIGPDLGWRHLDERTRTSQQRRFALGVESACERLGLGPLSRRGPLSH